MAELDPLIFVRVFINNHLVAHLSPHTQPDLQEQHPNAVNPQEAIEVAGAGDRPRVMRVSLTTLIIVR